MYYRKKNNLKENYEPEKKKSLVNKENNWQLIIFLIAFIFVLGVGAFLLFAKKR